MVIKTTIDSICEFVGGSQPEKAVFKYEEEEGYIRLIQTRDYKSDNFKTYIPIELAKKFCDETDIIIGRYGPPIFQIFRGLSGAYNVALMKAIPKDNVLKDYLYYFLKQDKVFRYVDALSARTGGQTGVDLESLRKYPVLLPDLEYQKKVVGILKNLDDKIALNNKISQNIEKMCLAMFEHWFLQFDFIGSDGKPYASSGGEMKWNSDLGHDIPKDWTSGSISDLGEIVAGGTPSTDNLEYYAEKGIAWITPNDLSEQIDKMFIDHGERDISEAGLKNSSAVLMPKGAILYSSRAPIGYIAIATNEVSTNQGFKSVVPNGIYGTYFVYYLLKKYTPGIASQGTGTTFKEVSKDTFSEYKIVLPPSNLARQFDEFVEPYCDARKKYEEESKELAKLRDFILPMLMTGQIKIS